MCIIAIKKAYMPMFADEKIRTMFDNNPDGAGYMYVKDHKVIIRKGFMKVEDLLESLHDDDLSNRNVIVHFRIGTSGLKDGLNNHPYPVFETNSLNMSCDLAMAHNGVLSNFTPPYDSKINDTQNFINKVLKKLDRDFINNKDKMFLISNIIGSNKLAFLDKDDSITLLGDFIEDEGYVYSNSSYKEKRLSGMHNYFSNYHYRPLNIFDTFTKEKSLNPKVMSFSSEKEMMNFINRIPQVYEIDEDLYEDMDGNVYDMDKDACLIYIN